MIDNPPWLRACGEFLLSDRPNVTTRSMTCRPQRHKREDIGDYLLAY
jgi:hypothetical protein